MKIRYSNSKLDIFRAQIRMLLSNRHLLIACSILGLFVIVMTFNGETAEEKTMPFRILYTLFSTLITLSFGGFFGFLFIAISALSKKQKGVIGDHELVIKEDGIEEINEYNQSLHKWSGMRGVVETGSFYLLYVTESSAHVVPKQPTRIEGNLTEFISQIRQKIRNV